MSFFDCIIKEKLKNILDNIIKLGMNINYYELSLAILCVLHWLIISLTNYSYIFNLFYTS